MSGASHAGLAWLPNAALTPGGWHSRRFRDAGASSFHDACAWIAELPYGANSRPDPDAVFVEGRGTCQSKHGAVAALAEELGLDVARHLGAYRLDETYVAGADTVLADHGLPFVPQLHCVLAANGHTVDLTAGNAHGKRRDIGAMDLVVRVAPHHSDAESAAVYAMAVAWYGRIEPAIARLPVADLRRIAHSCLRLSHRGAASRS